VVVVSSHSQVPPHPFSSEPTRSHPGKQSTIKQGSSHSIAGAVPSAMPTHCISPGRPPLGRIQVYPTGQHIPSSAQEGSSSSSLTHPQAKQPFSSTASVPVIPSGHASQIGQFTGSMRSLHSQVSHPSSSLTNPSSQNMKHITSGHNGSTGSSFVLSSWQASDQLKAAMVQ